VGRRGIGAARRGFAATAGDAVPRRLAKAEEKVEEHLTANQTCWRAWRPRCPPPPPGSFTPSVARSRGWSINSPLQVLGTGTTWLRQRGTWWRWRVGSLSPWGFSLSSPCTSYTDVLGVFLGEWKERWCVNWREDVVSIESEIYKHWNGLDVLFIWWCVITPCTECYLGFSFDVASPGIGTENKGNAQNIEHKWLTTL